MFKYVFRLRLLQHPQEHAVDGLRGVLRIPSQGMTVHAERVHVGAMAYKRLDFSCW